METRITQVTLHHWNSIVDCKCNCRNSIAEELLGVNIKTLPSFLAIRYAYIVGKYYSHSYNNSKNIDLLEKSNAWFDKAFIIGQSSRTEIKSPKLWFKRAKCKMDLALNTENIEDAKCLLEKASRIVEKALQKFGNTNSSLIWLRDNIKSNTNF